jgi:signal transduction histidine kinase/tetratricopeptide (TPR) repeat protein
MRKFELTCTLFFILVLSGSPLKSQVLDSTQLISTFDKLEKELQLMHFEQVIEKCLSLSPDLNQQNLVYLEYRNHRLLGKAYALKQEEDKALMYYLKGLNYIQKFGGQADKKTLLIEIGLMYKDARAFEKAREYLELAHEIKSEEKETSQLPLLLDNLGQVNEKIQQYQVALGYYEVLSGYYLQNKQIEQRIGILGRIAKIYQETGKLESAIDIYQIILEHYREMNDIFGIANIQNNLGFLYNRLKNYSQAYYYFSQVVFLDEQLKQTKEERGNALINLGVASYNINKEDEALTNLFKALEIFNLNKNRQKIAEINLMLASIYMHQGDLYNADFYAQYASAEAEAGKQMDLKAEALKLTSEIARLNNDYEKALEDYRAFLSIRDSLLIVQQLSKQQQLQKQYNLEKTASEIQLDLADEEVEQLSLRQLQLENEKRERELAILKQQKELQDLALRQQEQELMLTRRNLEAARKDQEIQNLQQQQNVQDLLLRQKELEEAERKATIEALQRVKQLQGQELEKAEKIRMYTYIIFAFAVIIIILMLIGYIQTKISTRKLAKQRDDIQQKNQLVEQKSREIQNQNELLAVQNQQLEQQQRKVEDAYRMLNDAHEKLKNAQTQMVEQEKMVSLGQLTAGIAHEINNPINFVSSNLSPLRLDISEIKTLYQEYQETRKLNDEQALARFDQKMKESDAEFIFAEIEALLKGIEEGASRTKDIVLGLRRFSRTDTGELALSNIHEGLDSTLVLLKNAAKHKAEIVKDYDPDLPMVECYPGKLNQVFMNIINNAIQAISEKGIITIRTRFQKSMNMVKIHIIDNGSGIPEHIQNKIFDPFFTTKDVGEGTGLGLSISYGIVQQHQGRIEVKSSPGKGSEFIIGLPVYQKLATEKVKLTQKAV